MIAKNRNNKLLKADDLPKSPKKNVKWEAVSVKAGDLESDFDTLFQRTEAPKPDLEPVISVEDAKIFDGQDLSYKDFSSQDLSGASFKNCNLTGSDFTGANLKNANFTGANLSSVILKDSDIENAIFLGINIDELGLEELQALIEYLAKYYPHKLNLLNFNLTMFDLRRFDLSKVNLAGLDFTGCDLTGVNILGLDLSRCIITPEQINQALGRPPTPLELKMMFTPRNKSRGFNISKFGEQMMKLFQSDGSTWGVIDVTKDKGVAIEDLMKFGKKVFKALSGKPEPNLEDMQMHIQRNMDNRVKDINNDKKKAIEEKKREMLEKMKEEPVKEDVLEKPLQEQVREEMQTQKRELTQEMRGKMMQRGRDFDRG